MKKPDHNQLLDDLLLGEEFHEHDSATLQTALGALSQKRRTRRFIRSLQAAAILLLFAALAVHAWLRSPQQNPPAFAQVNSVPVTPQLPPVPQLTDEELLASFPPGACAVTEVNGQTILVFRNAKERERYLQ